MVIRRKCSWNVDALMAVATNENPPLHLVLGSDALGLAEKKVETLNQALAAHRAPSMSTDFTAQS